MVNKFVFLTYSGVPAIEYMFDPCAHAHFCLILDNLEMMVSFVMPGMASVPLSNQLQIYLGLCLTASYPGRLLKLNKKMKKETLVEKCRAAGQKAVREVYG